jgi:hypothetical protein
LPNKNKEVFSRRDLWNNNRNEKMKTRSNKEFITLDAIKDIILNAETIYTDISL